MATLLEYFGGAPVIEVSGRGYPVETRYRPLAADIDDRFDPGLTAGLLAALEELATEPGEIGRGDTLVFLPGEREIRDAAEAIEQAYGERLEVLPLYARLAWADQRRVFERHGRRRVVLATNVAGPRCRARHPQRDPDSGPRRASPATARHRSCGCRSRRSRRRAPASGRDAADARDQACASASTTRRALPPAASSRHRRCCAPIWRA